jgi:NAD(P)-dependent dehydrogenase (short-subunit alcohol dehydrogenase family)
MIADAAHRFDENGNLIHEPTKQLIQKLLKNLVDWTVEFRLHRPETQAHDPNSRYARNVRACVWIPQFSRAEQIHNTLPESERATRLIGQTGKSGLVDGEEGTTHDKDLAHHGQLARLRAGTRQGSTQRRGQGGRDRSPPGAINDLVLEYADRVRAVALDVTDAAAARAAVQTAIHQFGTLDVVVNNAGYANSSPIEETPDDDFRAQIETNLFGVVNVTKAALPTLRKQRSGHFIQFSSIGGRIDGTPGMGAYQTAKWAVEGFSEVLSNEVKPFGIKVTIIEPGAFRTEWGGSSMRRLPISEDYDQTVGTMNRYRESTVDK